MIHIYFKIDVQGRKHLHPILWKLFGYICREYGKKGKKRIHVTSIAEGIHREGSFHYIYRAIDFCREGLIKRDLRIMINGFCEKYGKILKVKSHDFDLLEYEKDDFFHLEFDPNY